MSKFKPYPEIVVGEAGEDMDGAPIIELANGDPFVMTDIASIRRLVDCWNACRKLYSPANHISETDEYIGRLENLRKEAWARVEAQDRNSPSDDRVNPHRSGSDVANAGGSDVDRSALRAPVEAGTEPTSLAGGLESGFDHSFVERNASGPDVKRAPISSGWNFDIDAAPLGRHFTVTRTIKGEDRSYDDYEPQWLWLATKCGKVLKSHWLPPEGKTRPVGRWSGLAVNEQPVAWQLFLVPSHPLSNIEKVEA